MISAREPSPVTVFVTSKLGEEADACEDAISWQRHADCIRIAASDGATTSSFSREWAARLAGWFARRTAHANAEALCRTVPILGHMWLHEVGRRPLPWHAQEKLRQGAFATLLGVTVSGSGWNAVALGDTCLFHVRGGELLASFPYTDSEAFAARPVLASSVQPRTPKLMEYILEAQGELVPDDLLVVATDALAHWLLRSVEAGRPAWDLFANGTHERLAALVDLERTERRMRNDDVACAWLRA